MGGRPHPGREGPQPAQHLHTVLCQWDPLQVASSSRSVLGRGPMSLSPGDSLGGALPTARCMAGLPGSQRRTSGGRCCGELDSLPAQTLTPSADPGACSLPSELQRRGPPTASAPPCSLSTHCSQADPAGCPARRWPVLVPCVSPGHRCSGHVFPSRPHQRREGRACAGAPHPLRVSSHPHTYPTDMCQVLSATCGLWDIILVAGDSAGGGRQCGRAY